MARAFLDALEAKERAALTRLDTHFSHSVWVDHDACWYCGRPFRGPSNQSRCRRRDCAHGYQEAEERRQRARQEEIDLIAAVQADEAYWEKRTGRIQIKLYDPTRKQVSEDRSVPDGAKAYFDALVYAHDPDATVTHWEMRTPRYNHLTPWMDPTFDQALPALDVWLEARQRRDRIGSPRFLRPRGFTRPDVSGFSQRVRFKMGSRPV